MNTVAEQPAPVETDSTDLVARLGKARQNVAKWRALLREAQDGLHSHRLRAEYNLLGTVDGDVKLLGSTEADRRRAFDIAIELDGDSNMAISNVRTAERQLDEYQALLDWLLDQRRELEWRLRERAVGAAEKNGSAAWLSLDVTRD